MTALPQGPVVVDSPFLLALADHDPLAERFAAVLPRAIVTSIDLGQVMGKLEQRADMPPAMSESHFVEMLGVKVDAVDLTVARRFPDLMRIDARRRAAEHSAGAGVSQWRSLGDMACLAYAEEFALPVLTGDEHWQALQEHGLDVQVFDFRDPALVA